MSKSGKKNKKTNSTLLSRERASALEFTRLKAESIIKESQMLIKKIDSNGIEGYYSSNSDILRYATDINNRRLKSSHQLVGE